jgi:glycosyltransferase involved in cell wall biosynthesis
MASENLANAPVKLALVITELEPGGAERCLVELATRLDRSRWSPVVYSLAPRPPAGRDLLVSRLEASGVPVSFLGTDRVWQANVAVSRLAEHLREQRPQLVQAFLFHANVVAARAAAAVRVPHFFAGMRVADPRWWRTAAERWTTTAAQRFVCVSQSVAEFYRRRGFDAQKLVVIPNGIELARWQNATPFDWQMLGMPAGRRVLLYVGRLDRQKGLDRLLVELPATFRPLPDHHVVLVGEGPAKEALMRRAGRLRVAHRVHFAGWRSDVPSLMAAADVLVLPSRWEGMPNVVLEAMAVGKPVVATQAEGTVELLGLGAQEQTVAVGDWCGFRAQLVTIAGDPDLAARLGERNRDRAQQFSIENAIVRYDRLFTSVVRRSP